MRQKGRKSAAQLSVVANNLDLRPAPPEDLFPHEAEMWTEIVTSRAHDFFDVATQPLLKEYVRLQTQVDMMAEEIDSFEAPWLKTEDGVKRFRNLATIRDQAQGRMIALARTMRLTQQARYVPDKANNRPRGGKEQPKPWERN